MRAASMVLFGMVVDCWFWGMVGFASGMEKEVFRCFSGEM